MTIICPASIIKVKCFKIFSAIILEDALKKKQEMLGRSFVILYKGANLGLLTGTTK